MNQYNSGGDPVTPNNPWLVDNIYQGYSTEAVSETLNLVEYEKDLAGSTVIKELNSRRIFDRMGGKLGSYWGNAENLQYSTPDTTPGVISGVVLTDASAAVVVTDSDIDLEKIFESATKGRYVLKLTDNDGLAYYGWIGGIAKSTNAYTISIYSEVGLSTQTWVKTWGTGIGAPYAKVEIFDYSTSIEFATADTFNVELPYSEFATDYNQLKNLADGQYRIDYRRGRLLGRKLNADDTEIITYLGLKSADSMDADVDITKVGGVAVPTLGADGESNTRSDVPTSARMSGFNGTTWDRIRAGIKTVTSTLTGFLNTLPWGIYNASPTTRTDGQGGPIETANNGSVKTRSDAYDSSPQANRVGEINPLNMQFVGETLIDETNIAETTTAYAYIDMAGYRTLGIQAETSGETPTDVLTITLEATMQDDGTAAASCDYQDVTTALTGSASFVDTDFIALIDTPFAVKYLRVKYTTSTGGGDDADLTVYTKKLY